VETQEIGTITGDVHVFGIKWFVYVEAALITTVGTVLGTFLKEITTWPVDLGIV
jgi:hypothetical protein